MSEYRIYYLDPLNHVGAAADIEAASDADAVATAQAGRQETVEVWRLDRFFCQFNPVAGARRPRAR